MTKAPADEMTDRPNICNYSQKSVVFPQEWGAKPLGAYLPHCCLSSLVLVTAH